MLDAIRWFVGSAIASIVVGLRKVGLKGLRSPRNTAGAPSAAPPAPVSTALLMFQDPLAPIADKAPSPYKELKSQDSRHSIHLRFKNTLDEPIKIYWIGYDGHEVRYKTIDPGKTHRQQTFCTHPWTYATLTEPRLRLVVNDSPVYIHPVPEGGGEDDESMSAAAGDPSTPSSSSSPRAEDPLLEICRPRPRQWSPETHMPHFAAAFGDAVKAALFCHNRLRKAPAGVTNFGSLPIALRDDIIALAAPSLPTYKMDFDATPDTHPLGAGSRV